MKFLKIGYFADGPWAHRALDKIRFDPTLEIAFICARYESPDLYLEAQARKLGVDFFCVKDVNSNKFIEKLKIFCCDLFVSMSFNQIFKRELINIPKLLTINCHAGKLPFYRGRNVLNWALINGENEFGITVHLVDEGIDTGDIIVQNCYQIGENDDYSTLLQRAHKSCSDTLYEAIKKIQISNIKLVKQADIDPIGSYCIRRIAGDEILNWNQNSQNIFNFIRAICFPGPQARTFFGEIEVRINKARLLSSAKSYIGFPGSVIHVSKNSFYVKTLDTFIEILQWGGEYRPRVGDRLG